MRLLRDNIRLGSWLALIALALNLALSFGHIHAIGSDQRRVQVSTVTSSHGGQTGNHADDLCPTCMAIIAIANAVAPTPPVLPHPIADVLVDRATEPVLVFFKSPRAGFQSRAPPIS